MSLRPMVSTDIPASRCRTCGADNDMATARGRGPTPGDITICFGCGAVSQFNADLTLDRVDVDKLPAELRAQIRFYQANLIETRRIPS